MSTQADAKSKLANLNRFGTEVSTKLAKALTLMNEINTQHQNLDNLIKEIVSDHPVLEHMLKIAGDFDSTDDDSAGATFHKLHTVLETVLSVLKLDAVSYESELLKQIVERVK